MITRIVENTSESIRKTCEVLGVARSSFYEARTPSARQSEDDRLGNIIESIFREHRRRYGYRRIHSEMIDRKEFCTQERVRRLMRERGLQALCSRRFVPRTSDGKASLPAANLLEGRALPEAPNQVWAGDITYIPSSGGWLYLAVVIDLFSRRIVGWHLNDHMKSDLVVGALKKALATRAPLPGELIFHSDRGSQYGSRAFRSCLEENGIEQSMSKKAYPYDNAWTESFMGTLKSEMLGGGIFDTPADAQAALFEYIESYYNTKRKHSSLGYRTPSGIENLIPTALHN